MAVIFLSASLLLGMVWKQHAYVRFSRDLHAGEKRHASLHNAVLLLETEVRALRQPSRLETLARDRFGLIHPGPPLLVQPDGQILARGREAGPAGGMGIRAARWLKEFTWRIKGF
jgi:type II secretory pathway component PulJ